MARIASNKSRNHLSLDDIVAMPIADDTTRQWLAFHDLREEIELAIQALPAARRGYKQGAEGAPEEDDGDSLDD